MEVEKLRKHLHALDLLPQHASLLSTSDEAPWQSFRRSWRRNPRSKQIENTLQNSFTRSESGLWHFELEIALDRWPYSFFPNDQRFFTFSKNWGPFSRLTITGAEIQQTYHSRDDSILGEINFANARRKSLGILHDDLSPANQFPHDTWKFAIMKEEDEVSIPVSFDSSSNKALLLKKLLGYPKAPDESPTRAPCGHWDELGTFAWYKAHTGRKFRTEVDFQSGKSLCSLCNITAHAVTASTLPGDLMQENSLPSKVVLEMQPGDLRVISITSGDTNLGKIFWGELGSLAARLPVDLGIYTAGQVLDTSLIMHIVMHCHVSHRLCNSLQTGDDPIDILLVDVRDKCLVQAQTSFRYFALSYVNGTVSTLQTNSENLDELKIPGALDSASNLAKVIKDSIQVTAALGERYLWVDVLCIVQDDEVSKHHQIMQMDVIYRQSLLTLISLSGKNANISLPGILPGTRGPTRVASRTGLGHFLVEPVSPTEAITNSPYEKRGWTLQERLLPSRCLYFTSNQAFFQCCEGFFSEAMWTARETEDFRRHTVTGNDGQGLELLNPLNDLIKASYNYELTAPSFWRTYAELVTQYSPRHLSFPSDILRAFAGIMAVLERHWPAKFNEGLPLSLLDLALFWYPTALIRRREQSSDDGRESTLQFPSWSWAGWIGPVTYYIEGSTAAQFPSTNIKAFQYDGDHQLNLFPSPNKGNPGGFAVWVSENMPDAPSNNNADVRSGMATRKLHTLSFSAEAIGIDKLNFEPPLWEKDSTRIADAEAHQCGIFLDCGEVGNQAARETKLWSESYELVILSHSNRKLSRKSGFTIYTSDGNYKEPFGDLYSKMPGPWKMINVMLVRRCGESYRRIAVGMMHEKVVQALSPIRKDICLV